MSNQNFHMIHVDSQVASSEKLTVYKLKVQVFVLQQKVHISKKKTEWNYL